MAKTLLLVGGHGAGDPGAAGNGTIEANETRRVNQALYNKLRGSIPVTIYDVNKDLYQTNDHASLKSYEIIETHFNAFNGSARGTEVLIKSGFSADALDNGLLGAMAKYFTNRGIKQRNDLANMNKFASMGTSYRLIEVCFIDSGDMAVYNSKFNALITDMANTILKVYGVSQAPAPSKPAQKAGNPINSSGIFYQGHVQNIGDCEVVRDGQVCGTTGYGLRLEGLYVDTRKFPEMKINAYAHIQDIGDVEYKDIKQDTLIGTTGKSKRMEALHFEVEEYGTAKGKVLKFRVHEQNKGWSSWATEGAFRGSTGEGRRIEAVQIVLE